MINVMEQYICDLIINVLKKSNTSLTFNEIKEQLTCKIDEVELDAFLFGLTEQGKLKQSRVLTPQGNFTAWSINNDK